MHTLEPCTPWNCNHACPRIFPESRLRPFCLVEVFALGKCNESLPLSLLASAIQCLHFRARAALVTASCHQLLAAVTRGVLYKHCVRCMVSTRLMQHNLVRSFSAGTKHKPLTAILFVFPESLEAANVTLMSRVCETLRVIITALKCACNTCNTCLYLNISNHS